MAGDNPSDASSTATIRALLTMARTKASICCSPPLRLPATWPNREPRAGNSWATRSIDAFSSPLGDTRTMFSLTLRDGKIPRPSGMWKKPFRAMAWAGTPGDVFPRQQYLAAACLYQPCGHPEQRCLAGAVGAEHGDDGRGCDRKAHVSKDRHGAVAGVHVAQFEEIASQRRNPTSCRSILARALISAPPVCLRPPPAPRRRPNRDRPL